MADAPAGRVPEGVGNGGGDGDDWGFTPAGRRQVGAVQEMDVEFRHIMQILDEAMTTGRPRSAAGKATVETAQ